VKDLGDAFNLDIERLLLLNPQVVMTSAYNAEDENSKRMRQTGLTLLYNIEWQEKTLLGRAEWIKFMGAFFDKEALADSIFSNVAKRYNDIKSQAAALISSAPTVLSGQDFRGTWSMPGGQSFNARLFHDAGARYYYAGNNASGSIATSIEEALLHFSDATIWVNVQASTLEELGKMDKKYKLFKAYQNGNVYNTLKRSTATGGNDYWENGVARPDLLLSDMIRICYPSLLPDYELTYTKRLPPQ
jgi:iron complex transport system substrate-binding protein